MANETNEPKRSLIAAILNGARTVATAIGFPMPPIPGEWDTEGGDEGPPEPVARLEPGPEWADGWYLGAIRKPSHPGRWGKAITPRGRVTHTTDMMPSTFAPLLRNWTTQRGRGNGAHFLLGRTKEDGLVQLCPINRNGNHAGGPLVNGKRIQGWIKMDGKLVHPNTLYVGIEVHCAGGLHLIGGQWRDAERKDGKLVPKGPAIPASDVEVDPVRPTRGFHRPTAYQLDQLARLYDAMDPLLKPFPKGAVVIPSGEVDAWALPGGVVDVGHVSLDPVRKTDPGYELMRFVRARNQRRAGVTL